MKTDGTQTRNTNEKLASQRRNIDELQRQNLNLVEQVTRLRRQRDQLLEALEGLERECIFLNELAGPVDGCPMVPDEPLDKAWQAIVDVKGEEDENN